MKLTKRNKKELKKIAVVLALIGAVFLWAARNIGLPIKTNVKQGRIQVIDVSSYNGKVNWKKVKDQKINHAMLKIGSGIRHPKRKGKEDPLFAANYRNASYAAIHTGVYYYSYAATKEEAGKEAEHCLSLLKKHGIQPDDLDLPVAFDIEERDVLNTGKENVSEITAAFCDKIKKAGYTPMVYSSASALKNHFIYDKIKNYEIWVAHYTDASSPAIPFEYRMWQYTSSASIEGANTKSGRCDVNYYLMKERNKGI